MGHNKKGVEAKRERTVYNGQTPLTNAEGEVQKVRGERRVVSRQARTGSKSRQNARMKNESEKFNTFDVMSEVAGFGAHVGKKFSFSVNDLSRSGRKRLSDLAKKGYIKKVETGYKSSIVYEIVNNIGKQDLKKLDPDYYSTYYAD